MTQEPKIFPYIARLLQGAEVVWKPLGEVAEYEQPTKYLVKSSNYKDIYPTPVLTAGKTFILGYTDEIEGIYKASISPVIIFDDFTTANKWVDFDFKAKSSAMKMITSKNEEEVLLKYIYYWLNTLPSELIEGDHKRQWISNYANKKIPLPPLSVQQEIVRILDKFTELEAELEAELDCRKRQYDYYRNHLLSYEGNEVVWKTLGEVVKTTKNIKWQNNENTYDYIDLTSVCRETGNVLETLKIKADNAPSRAQKMVQLDDVIFATTRPSQMRIALIPKKFDGQIASTGYCILRADKVNVLPKWIFFTLSTTEFKKFVAENQSGTAYPAISDSKLKEFKIPLPPLSEQQRIVGILDKFDTLVHSISEGLPREIELRKKQYEYYREQLLSFPEYKVTA
jgi:restriction modification system DNA specificity domain protein